MVVNVIFFAGIKQHNVVLILQQLNNTLSKILLKLDDVTNNDVLGFDSRLLFLSADIIAPILNFFYNVSIEIQRVNSDWNLPKVTPIYKGKGSKDDACNYRPIRLIGHIMKIFEK